MLLIILTSRRISKDILSVNVNFLSSPDDDGYPRCVGMHSTSVRYLLTELGSFSL
jgi:hypothetical protein